MAGQAKHYIDTIVKTRGKGNPAIERGVRVKLILKGIQPEKYGHDTPDDPIAISLIRSVAADLGVELN